MLRIEASRMSMNWTRQSRIRIATPRLDDRDAASCARGAPATGEVAEGMTRVSFRFASQKEDTRRLENVTSSRPLMCGPKRGCLDLKSRQPVEPAWQVPVPASQQVHHGRKQDRADDRRVDQQGDGDPETHLLEHDELARGETREDGDENQRCAGDEPRTRRNTERE